MLLRNRPGSSETNVTLHITLLMVLKQQDVVCMKGFLHLSLLSVFFLSGWGRGQVQSVCFEWSIQQILRLEIQVTIPKVTCPISFLYPWKHIWFPLFFFPAPPRPSAKFCCKTHPVGALWCQSAAKRNYDDWLWWKDGTLVRFAKRFGRSVESWWFQFWFFFSGELVDQLTVSI